MCKCPCFTKHHDLNANSVIDLMTANILTKMDDCILNFSSNAQALHNLHYFLFSVTFLFVSRFLFKDLFLHALVSSSNRTYKSRP